jgi:hypothetical protein
MLKRHSGNFYDIFCLIYFNIDEFVRMRESYKRFVKTWIRFANPWIRFVITNPDSKKVYFVPYKTNPGFVSYRGSRILTLKDSFRIVNHESSQFSKIRLFLQIQRILTNP